MPRETIVIGSDVNGGPITRTVQVRTNSYIIPETWMTSQQIRRKINAARQAALAAALLTDGDQEYNVRALVGSDMPDRTTNDWLETTASSGVDAWNNSAFAAGSNIADNTYIGIYGVQVLTMENEAGVNGGPIQSALEPAVTGIRIQIGGARVAQWDLHPILYFVGGTDDLATSSTEYGPLIAYPKGFAESPVVITKEKSLTVAFWETQTSLDFQVALLGIVVEAVGSGAGLNP